MTQILHIDSSARQSESVTRELSQSIAERFAKDGGMIVRRDLSGGLPFIDAAWVGANFTPADQRSPEQVEKLALSEELVAELEAAEVIVIGVPIYNFNMPAVLKAWIDLVARAGRTFRYTENGPVGLLTGKRVILAVASGGTEVGSPIDHMTGYLRHVLGFIGLSDVEIIAADALAADAAAKLDAARAAIPQLAA
ncbi:MAG: NAD(P)H-dependent oxidoreductase [Rhodobacteraceae bacterium]|nr:NAD(P)H-dependent oxidoreductase [Paracoccaceae bacterium]